jgi:hypothetical protein
MAASFLWLGLVTLGHQGRHPIAGALSRSPQPPRPNITAKGCGTF